MSADILVVPKIESKGHHLSIVLAKQRLDISCKGGAIVRYCHSCVPFSAELIPYILSENEITSLQSLSKCLKSAFT